MGPSRKTPRKERAPLNYENVGQVGRRTGAKWNDTGVRDENGMEPMPAFSPEKPAYQPNGAPHESSYSADDSMDIGQSTIAEPDIVVRSTRNARLSIPRSVSPRKNLMNGSPRRSMTRSVGPFSSPPRNDPDITPSHVPVNRTLDFSMDKSRTTIEASSHNSVLPKFKAPKVISNASKGKQKGPFDLEADSDEDDQELGVANDETMTDGLLEDNYISHDNGALLQEENTVQSIEEDDEAAGPSEETIEPAATSEATGRPKRRGGRTRKAPTEIPDDLQMPLSDTGPARRGRPPRKEKPEVYKDKTDAKGAPMSSSATVAKGKRKAGPSERDPNIKFKAPRTGNKAPASRAASVVPRSAYTVQRSETPATDSGAFVTRSGRHSFKPLASWRGERVILGQRESIDTLPGIQDIVRTEEIMPPPRPRPNYYRSSKRKARSQPDDVEEEDEGVEPWEAEQGIQYAQVMEWIEEAGTYDEDSTEVTEIAYAADAIEMRDISGASFKFAKTLTVPFFGSGMVHLPPGAEKRVKNSRKYQMVFFIFYGRVTVNVGTPTTTFSIGKGGQWQVPRGNFYSIINESLTQPARMFFAQGCEWARAAEAITASAE